MRCRSEGAGRGRAGSRCARGQRPRSREPLAGAASVAPPRGRGVPGRRGLARSGTSGRRAPAGARFDGTFLCAGARGFSGFSGFSGFGGYTTRCCCHRTRAAADFSGPRAGAAASVAGVSAAAACGGAIAGGESAGQQPPLGRFMRHLRLLGRRRLLLPAPVGRAARRSARRVRAGRAGPALPLTQALGARELQAPFPQEKP